MRIALFAAIAVGALTAIASAASAATLDFEAEAFGNERGVTNGTVITMDGLDVTFTSSNYAYFDEGAGLGVCKNLTPSLQCAPAHDDNVTLGEWVTLSFDSAQTISNLDFFAEGHVPLTSRDTLLVMINGEAFDSYTFRKLSRTTFDDVTSLSFLYGGPRDEQFYLNSATATAKVPLPATLPLLAGALLLLRRRRRSAA